MNKYLCICQYGHSRSVAMCRYLHHRKQEAVAVGIGTAPSSILVLSEWADVIVLMEPGFIKSVPVFNLHKCVLVNVGPDRWSNPYHPDLAALIEKLADEEGLVKPGHEFGSDNKCVRCGKAVIDQRQPGEPCPIGGTV